MEEYKISIIIPVYNTKEYVERCLNSVINQTYKNIEIICIDDGSTDGSEKILDKFAQIDQRVKVIHKKNEGVVEARNTGLKNMNGDYVGFVDSDDYIKPEMYSELMNALINSQADIATCNYYFDYKGKIKVAENKKEVPLEVMDCETALKYMYERDIYQGVASYLWTRLFKRELFEEIWFKNEYEGFDDIVFIAEMMTKMNTMIYVNKSLYYYYQRDNSIVHDVYTQASTLNWIKAYEKIIDLYDRKNVDEAVMNIIKRMYVYRCCKTLEFAKNNIHEFDTNELTKKINKYAKIYIQTNKDYPDRIMWINDLLRLS